MSLKRMLFACFSSERLTLFGLRNTLLHSLNPLTKETVTRSLGRSCSDPRLSLTVQLCHGDTGRLLDFFGRSLCLTCQYIPSIDPSPAFLHIQPTSSFGMKSCDATPGFPPEFTKTMRNTPPAACGFPMRQITSAHSSR